jgi:hypothetical protein
MTLRRLCAAVFLIVLAIGPSAFAQSKNELGLLIGATLVPDQNLQPNIFSASNIKFSKGTSYQATYARRLFGAGIAGLQFEIPFIGVPNSDVSSNNPLVPTALASLFITPALRLKVLPDAGISPWVSLGGGYARFDEGRTLQDGSPNPSARGTNKGVLEYGGGIDIKLIHYFGVRGEVRDFYTGRPQLNALTSTDRQHNIVVSGGIVLFF